MSAFLVVEMAIHDKEGYAAYPPLASQLVARHSGELRHLISDFEALEGDWHPQRLIVIEFPTKAAARAFLDDPDYASVKEIRAKTTTSRIVVGDSELP